MVHGNPDWNRITAPSTTFQLRDVGESAVRQGSIVSFDRRGDVIWFDDFESSLNKWATFSGGAGGGVAISSARARNGTNSCALTAGSDGALNAQIIHRDAGLVAGRFAVEVSFNRSLAFSRFEIRMISYDRVNLHQFTIRIDDVNDTLHFADSSLVFQEFATIPDLPADGQLFHTAKLVVDQAEDEYVRFLLNSVVYDLSGNAGHTSADVTTDRLDTSLLLVGIAASNSQLFIDDVILTQNEP